MRWLFVVFVASLCALLWAAIAVARHVRHNRGQLPAGAGIVEVDEQGRLPEQRLSEAESGDEHT
jgi:multisubunit Na+/H+ antiporter MnhE subunit